MSQGDAFEFLATASGNLRMDSVRNTGPLDRDVWLKEVAKSKFMVRPRRRPLKIFNTNLISLG
jgi:hypothetical protein